AGYEQLVTDVNAAEGVDVGGKKRPLKLVVLDNRSDPNTTTQQTRELVLQDAAVAILGACTPPIVVPGALAVEQQKVPFVTTCAPVKAFQGGNPNGWHYAWDVFFDEQEQATHALSALAKADSSKKLAVFTDNEPDGVFERALYTATAPTAGLQVVGDYTFPVGTTDYSSFINDAKAKGADLVVAQMIPPDGIALWKQMKAANFSPKAGFVAKAATGASWGAGLGDVANGTLTEAWWSPTAGKANTQALIGTLGKQFGENFSDLNIAVLGYSVANIASDAISAAGSTDPAKVNEAFGKTDKDYPLGHVKFNDKGTAVTPILLLMQWQAGKIVQVDPPVAGNTFQVPVKGLQ
ncbi:MAG: ABC transporter substrate-binding protein, partial [Acidimicrobiales bacterium]